MAKQLCLFRNTKLWGILSSSPFLGRYALSNEAMAGSRFFQGRTSTIASGHASRTNRNWKRTSILRTSDLHVFARLNCKSRHASHHDNVKKFTSFFEYGSYFCQKKPRWSIRCHQTIAKMNAKQKVKWNSLTCGSLLGSAGLIQLKLDGLLSCQTTHLSWQAKGHEGGWRWPHKWHKMIHWKKKAYALSRPKCPRLRGCARRANNAALLPRRNPLERGMKGGHHSTSFLALLLCCRADTTTSRQDTVRWNEMETILLDTNSAAK